MAVNLPISIEIVEPLWVFAEAPVIKSVYANVSTLVIVTTASRKLRAYIIGAIDRQAAVCPT
jgi:hypothetical protein